MPGGGRAPQQGTAELSRSFTQMDRARAKSLPSACVAMSAAPSASGGAVLGRGMTRLEEIEWRPV
jgi:hypothetical protein